MKFDKWKVIEVVLLLASAGVGIGQAMLGDHKLDAKIAEHMAKAQENK